jgi:hypothetical protein
VTLSTTTNATWFIDAFASLARGDDHSFAHFLDAFEEPVILDATRTTVRTHFLASDANGIPATEQLANAMATFLLDFSIPRSRIKRAWNEYEATSSSASLSALQIEAKNLLVKSDSSGEGGELLLYMLMEKSLGFPQILSKMPLKTNPNVHVHGSDGVHARLGDDGILDLYWGESKLYKSSSSAFTDCFDSIAPFLHPDNHNARLQDLVLIREFLNIDDETLAAHMIRYFDESHPESLLVRWNGVCLIGFDIDDYPNLGTAIDTELQGIAAQVGRWQASVLKRITDHQLLSVNIDVFCIPLPSVMKLRQAVRAKLGS